MPKIKKNCDQCQPMIINGVFCHEHGCPNERKTWIDDQWVMFVTCFNCGEDVEEGTECNCQDHQEEEE